MPSAWTCPRMVSISQAGSTTMQSRVSGSPMRYTKFCIGPSSICLRYSASSVAIGSSDPPLGAASRPALRLAGYVGGRLSDVFEALGVDRVDRWRRLAPHVGNLVVGPPHREPRQLTAVRLQHRDFDLGLVPPEAGRARAGDGCDLPPAEGAERQEQAGDLELLDRALGRLEHPPVVIAAALQQQLLAADSEPQPLDLLHVEQADHVLVAEVRRRLGQVAHVLGFHAP